MKTEAELRKYRDALRVCHTIPCDCANTAHATDCVIGGEQMKKVIVVLSWIIGECPDHDRVVERIIDAAARHKAGA